MRTPLEQINKMIDNAKKEMEHYAKSKDEANYLIFTGKVEALQDIKNIIE